jgi:membrane protein
MPINLRETAGDTVLILRESVRSFKKNNGLEKSASLAYYGFFALIPLLLLSIYLIGNYIVSSKEVIKGIENLTAQIFPQAGNLITKEVYSLSRHKKLWGLLGIITLFWTITPLAGSLRKAFAAAFRADREERFFKRKMFDSFAVLVILVLFVMLVLSEIFYPIASRHLFGHIPAFVSIGNIIGPLLGIMFFMSVFYFALSPVKLRMTHVLAGAFTTAVLWSVIRPVFSAFLKINPDYGLVFGSMKAVFILIVWVYYSFSVIIFGAEVIANARRKNALLLKGLFLGSRLSDEKYRALRRKFVKTYNEGDAIFKEGDVGSEMFHILSGTVTISKNEQTLRTMKKGEYFGEMSMLLNTPRTATATASEAETEVVVISRDNLETILKEEPRIMMSFLKELAMRLKITSEYL